MDKNSFSPIIYLQSALPSLMSWVIQSKVRAIIYILIFLSLWGCRMSEFIFNEPLDVLTNFGRAVFVIPLSHEDIVLMIVRGALMYASFIICAFYIIEAVLKLATNMKTFSKAFIIMFISLVLAELYWERNYDSLIHAVTNCIT